ncbi:hypothetical protein [Agrococcus jejuensis]|uniref:YtxH domain-containing protein n=1 Tax=Agrococcus jejuensis TaxID=399736 RepID=A0A1G8DNS1_9MICO|nr:hypothetical protein [Agrococcus jejuensis]SDH59255.1 hypothetical protein SAMN04489720_1714 [Agrococcus jejuensis]
MQRQLLILGGVAATGFILGVRATRPRSKRPPETLRHQLERLWADPRARRARAKVATRVSARR